MGQVDMGEGDHRTCRYVGGRTWDSYGRGSLGQVDIGYGKHGTGRYGGGRAWDM